MVISDQQTGYDEAGDGISAVVDPSGKHLVTSTTYDGAGRKHLVIAPPANPNTTDPTDPNGVSNVTTYSYDADSNVTDTRVTNSRVSTTGNIVGETTVGYNATGTFGVMAVYSDAAKTQLAYKATYGYDAGTRTSTLTDLVGPTATALHNYSYSYDTATNITSVADAVGGASSSYTYDNLNQLKTVTDGTGTTTFSYDANHNRQTMVATVGTSSYTTRYTYDAQADQELLSKTDPSNKTTTYTYDTAGNLTQAVYDPTSLDPGGANRTTTYGYDTRGRLISVNTPDGTANGTTITYNVSSG